jgi:hypothetical protein
MLFGRVLGCSLMSGRLMPAPRVLRAAFGQPAIPAVLEGVEERERHRVASLS